MGERHNQLITILFAVLMATSLVAMPAMASGPSTAPEPHTTTAVDGDRAPVQHGIVQENTTTPRPADEFSSNTSVEALLRAGELLAEIEPESEAEREQLNETRATINASLAEFQSPQRITDEAAFEHLVDAQTKLPFILAERNESENKTAEKLEGDIETIENVSRQLYEASALATQQSLEDTDRALNRHATAFPTDEQYVDANEEFEHATDEFQRGNEIATNMTPIEEVLDWWFAQLIEASEGEAETEAEAETQFQLYKLSIAEQFSESGVDVEYQASFEGNESGLQIIAHGPAIEHHKTAWERTQSVHETIASHTEPDLSLTQQQVFEENGSVHVRVDAQLRDVHADTFENGTVTVDGDNATPIELSPALFGHGEATGTTTIDLGSEPENQTVTVTTASAADPERNATATLELTVDEDEILWDLPALDEQRPVNVTDDDSGVSVDVDGPSVHESLVSVEDETPTSDDDYRAGPMVRITNETSFDSAEVSIPVDDADLDREGNLSIVTWDPNSDEPWTSVETEIDRDAGVATAEVDHFSFFSAFWLGEWEDEYSDSIVLTDEAEENDDVDIELIDVMFVVDESGSMSGSRIRNAREASKRFVGALTDDEQGGLVGYATSSGLEHELTRNHDSLNRSIESLDAGGSTNTGAGLEEALEEFERNSLEDRSQVIVLLSDGYTNRGPDPVGIAETAAERDIEISTVGVGDNIDENELEEIADTTGGDFYHVEDDDALPDTFARVAENQTGVDLQDTNGDGIPDRVAEMDLTMPSGPPGIEGEPLNLDPIALDTSGDGILDNETVDIDYEVSEEVGETTLTATVTHAEHHPARVDTTGDGLTDAQQVEGWEIDVVESVSDAQALMETVADPDDNTDPSSFFRTRSVSANPLLEDTDGDDIADATEFELGTDPEKVDTTNDGVPDEDALEAPDEDPTVFTTSPPDVHLIDFNPRWTSGDLEVDNERWEWPDIDVDRPGYVYDFDIRVTDRSGVSRVSLSQSSVTEFEDTYPDVPSVEEDIVFHAEGEQVLSYARGSETTVTTADMWTNEGTELVQSKRSIGGALEEWDADSDTVGFDMTRDHGQLSGFTHGTAELPDFFRILLGDPATFTEPIAEYVTEYQKTHYPVTVEQIEEDEIEEGTLEETGYQRPLWIDMVVAMGAETHRTQAKDNPYESPTGTATGDLKHCADDSLAAIEDAQDVDDWATTTSSYCEFAAGWYEGYGVFLIAESTVGTKGLSKGADGISSASDLRRVLDETDVGSNRAFRAFDGQNTKAGQIASRIADEGYDDLGAQFRTAGKETQAVKTLDEVDTQVLRELDETQRTELLRHLADHPDGVRLLDNLGPESSKAMFRSDADLEEIFQKYERIPRHQQNRFANFLRDDDIGQSWLQVVSDKDIYTAEISKGIARSNEISNYGRISDFKTGKELNAQTPDHYQPIHKPDSVVVDYRLTEETTYYRMYSGGSDSNLISEFTTRSRTDITSLDVDTLSSRYALPNDPDAVGVARIEPDIEMRSSTVAKNEWGTGGKTQHIIQDETKSSWFERSNELTQALRES